MSAYLSFREKTTQKEILVWCRIVPAVEYIRDNVNVGYDTNWTDLISEDLRGAILDVDEEIKNTRIRMVIDFAQQKDSVELMETLEYYDDLVFIKGQIMTIFNMLEDAQIEVNYG